MERAWGNELLFDPSSERTFTIQSIFETVHDRGYSYLRLLESRGRRWYALVHGIQTQLPRMELSPNNIINEVLRSKGKWRAIEEYVTVIVKKRRYKRTAPTALIAEKTGNSTD